MLKQYDKGIFYWLISGCLLIALMVIIGGITRLTHSGLSIVQWKIITGILPPFNNNDWIDLFEKYKQTPEFKQVNHHFSINDYKSIFWWEYIHRLIGRLTGIVFIIPFIYFLIKKRIKGDILLKLLIIFLLGTFQGFLGWFMVKSGLINVPRVSHLRLASHLITAFITFAFTFWTALCVRFPTKTKLNNKKLLKYILIIFSLITVQIIYGAFVAGLRAGYIYNTFPKMGDKWIADAVFAIRPLWQNFINGLAGVQFVHRYLAILILIAIFILWINSRKMRLNYFQRKGINILFLLICLQFILGIITLLTKVPIYMGIIHQITAFLLFASNTYLLFFSKFYIQR